MPTLKKPARPMREKRHPFAVKGFKSGAIGPPPAPRNVAPALLAKSDGIEVSPVRFLTPRAAGVEGGVSASEAHFWSVYLHQKTGGAYCLGDFYTRAEANAYARALLAKVKRRGLAFPFGISSGAMP